MKHARKTMHAWAWTVGLAAAATVPALAGGSENLLSVEAGASAETRAQKGLAPLHVTPNIVLNLRLVEIPNSAGVVAVWEELTPNGVTASFYTVSLDGKTFSRVFQTGNTIRLRYASFDPALGTPLVPATLRADAANKLYIVQFVSQPLVAFQAALRAAGAVIHTFVADNAVVAEMTPAVRDTVAQLAFVRWVGPLHPAYKLDESILDALAGSGPDGQTRHYSILVFGRGMVSQQPIADRIRATGGAVIDTSPDAIRMTATLTPVQVLDVARMNGVHFIDPWGPGEVDMDIARQIGGAVPILSSAGFTGQGVRGEVFGTGVQLDHPEWNGQEPLIHGVLGSPASHGTGCYGINFSTGVVQSQATGMLPDREQGISCSWHNSTVFGGAKSPLLLNTEATDPAGPYWSVFQTSSVGSPRTSNYTTTTAETDDTLFRVDYLTCQAMGADHLIPVGRPQCWAKNIVSLGGVLHQNTLTRTDDSAEGSVGPASDGRVKPDLIHFYDTVYTTTSASGYVQFGGTSASTPITAGHFGLLFQMWHEQVFPGQGGGASVFFSRPKSTTAKALMINTAYRYDWHVPGPNSNLTRMHQGWGMADVGKLYQSRNNMFIVDETDLLTPLAVRQYQIAVAPQEPELAVTLVYIDPPGNPAMQSQHRVNDLTLKVISPVGTVYWGNHDLTDGNYSTPGGSPNTKDTVENVFIETPEAGDWTVEVHGDEIVQDSHLETPEVDADYALVVRGGKLHHLGDLNCDGEVNFDDIDPFVLALSGQAAYYAQYPNCYWLNADCNADGDVNFDDIDPFVALLSP